jgi:alpha-methylacyl-CoA racemase
MQPLSGVRILDFSTLLPGPMATLLLADAGAEVIKIERPNGEEMRGYEPKIGNHSVNFGLLNAGKRSVAIDLKAPGSIEELRPLIASADIVIEQFRPGVMDRLGLGYEALKVINPRIIYCAITGYGQSGPKAQIAAHDLNYVAESGLLAIAADPTGAPVVPPALIADIAGGAYPAVMNVLLALRQREQTGEGCKIDVSMSDNMFTFLYWAMGEGFSAGKWPKPGGGLIAGGSPRYQIYRTADNKFVAAAPLEQKFWENFCELIGLEKSLRDDRIDIAATKRGVAAIIAKETASIWAERFIGKDVCCCIVKTIEEATRDPHFVERGLFARTLNVGGRIVPALHTPVSAEFRAVETDQNFPVLASDNKELLPPLQGED